MKTDEFEFEDEDGTKVVRVPLHLMDGCDDVQHAIALDSAKQSVTDGFGRTAGHRPGYCYAEQADRSKVQAAYDGYKAELGKRWQKPPATLDEKSAKQLPQLTRDQAYAQYEQGITNAWRTGVAV